MKVNRTTAVGLVVVSLFWVSVLANAGVVRVVSTNGKSMASIRLRIGQSTVLRFPEKPKKVVLGNANYYSVEFIENDLALQPLGTVGTNLFVYGEKNVYGFLLSTRSAGRYDDLVHVQWENKAEARKALATVILKSSPVRKVSEPGINFGVGKVLKANILQVKRFRNRDTYIVDVGLHNVTKNKLLLREVEFEATRAKRVLPMQKFVVMDGSIEANGKTLVRLFLELPEKRGFTLHVRLKDEAGSKIVPRRYL